MTCGLIVSQGSLAGTISDVLRLSAKARSRHSAGILALTSQPPGRRWANSIEPHSLCGVKTVSSPCQGGAYPFRRNRLVTDQCFYQPETTDSGQPLQSQFDW